MVVSWTEAYCQSPKEAKFRRFLGGLLPVVRLLHVWRGLVTGEREAAVGLVQTGAMAMAAGIAGWAGEQFRLMGR